jgi:DNA excision repair protein ERCC-4
MQVELIIDNREVKLIQKLNNINQQIVVKQLPIGDIIYKDPTSDKIICIIERKTINDLASSIIDGRYHSQKNKLLKLDCSKIYLIEGSINNLRSKINKDCLYGAIVNTSLRDNFHIFSSSDLDESVIFILKIKKFFENIDINKIKTIEIEEINKLNNKNIYLSQLCQITGLSIKVAKKIEEKYNTMYSLVEYLKSVDENNLQLLENLEIETNTGKKRRLGSKLSIKIYNSLIFNK